MSTRAKKLHRELPELFEARMDRRLTLKLMAGTAATGTLVACGVNPAPTPQPAVRTNTVVLRGRLKGLTGQGRDRLRAIAAFLDPANRRQVDILGEYWLASLPIIHGKPGRDFLGEGMDLVVIARGESSAAVREWAAQWSDVLDFDGDDAERVEPLYPAGTVPQAAAPTFLVFERRGGAVAPQKVLGAAPGGVSIASHHVLVNDRNRQVLVVRAPSREAVRAWVNGWGARQAVEVLALTNLSGQLTACSRAARAEPLPAAAPGGSVRAADYHPDGAVVTGDQKVGKYYLRHASTGRFLSINSNGAVVTVPVPSTGDRWAFVLASDLDPGKYRLVHQDTYLTLGYDFRGTVFGSLNADQYWVSGPVADQTYGAIGKYSGDPDAFAILSADSNGVVSTSAPTDTGPAVNWEQWTNYDHPSQAEQTIRDIVTTATYDAPWPEDAYTGDDLTAYTTILGRLREQGFTQPPKTGNVPSGRILKLEGDMAPPAGSALKKVFDHLYDVAEYHETLHAWYGDGQNLDSLLNDINTNNTLVLTTIVPNMVSLPAGTNLKFELAACFNLLALGIAGLGGGPVVGAVLAGIWRLYSSTSAGANDTLRTTFANLGGSLSATFNALITQRQDARSTMAANWGKLSKFAGMVDGGTLVWPDDTADIRDAAKRQFETAVWQSVSKALWVITGGGSISRDRPDESHDSMGTPWTYILQAPAQYTPNCGSPGPGWLTDFTAVPLGYAPDSVAQHLFGDPKTINPTYPTAENLGISMTDFFVGKNGWGIPADVS